MQDLIFKTGRKVAAVYVVGPSAPDAVANVQVIHVPVEPGPAAHAQFVDCCRDVAKRNPRVTVLMLSNPEGVGAALQTCLPASVPVLELFPTDSTK